MQSHPKTEPASTVPVHFPRPGERYVRVKDLVADPEVRRQIGEMAKIEEDKTPPKDSA